MLFMTVYFSIAVAISGALAWLFYRVLRRYLRFAGRLAIALWLFLAVFLFPIPIHGGFMLSGELWLDAVDEWQRDREWAAEARRDAEFEQALDARFGAPVAVSVLARNGHWSAVQTAFGPDAYLHRDSGLAFTDPMPWQPVGEVTWEQAHAHCQQLEPPGSWALPTQAELYLFWRDGGRRVSPWGIGRFVSVLADPAMGIRLTARHLGPGPEKLRCVARTDVAGAAGFTRDVISLEDWNRYQMDPDRYR